MRRRNHLGTASEHFEHQIVNATAWEDVDAEICQDIINTAIKAVENVWTAKIEASPSIQDNGEH